MPDVVVLIDADGAPRWSTIATDVCIIGAGPAGLVVAHDLIGSGRDVIVLESGRQEWDATTQALAEGAVTGEPFRFNGVDLSLADTRMRQFGGSSNHWTGQCRPLDPHDLDARAATGGVGWPFAFDVLEPWYRRAGETLQLLSSEWSDAWWREATGSSGLTTGDGVRQVVFQFSPPTRFGERLGPALAAAPDVRVYLGATAVELVPDRDGSRVRSIEVRTLSGNQFTVEATTVVLATGGVDVPRLLLASRGASPSGLGNSNDLVGRFFMEHPHAIGGRAVLTASAEELEPHLIAPRTLADGTTGLTGTGLAPAPEVQDAMGTTNGCVLLWPEGEGPPRGERDADAGPTDAVRALLGGGPTPPTLLTMAIRTEQAPNPDSRVVLGTALDTWSVPRAEVRWELTDADRRTLRGTVEAVGESLGAAGLGRIEIDPGGRPIEQWPIEIGNHHMGTTRMHGDPAQGVVDADGRLHEVTNVYVCGSAVFPTSGMANPTLTIVALAHRLAAHLRGDGPSIVDGEAAP